MPDYSGESIARPFWSGTITFGLVSIPVSLFAANRPSRVALHMIGPRGNRLRRRYFSQDTGRELTGDEIVRGYEISKNHFVVVTDDELDRLAPEKSRDIDLRRFVPYAQIPKIYFEHGYFLAPAGASGRAYRLLAETMERSGQAGIATFVMRGKEYLVAIVAENGILRAETLRFYSEIRKPDEVGLPLPKRAAAAAVRAFEKLIAQRAVDELPRHEMHNREADRLLDLVHRKSAAHKDTVTSRWEKTREQPPRSRPVDLIGALQRALRMPPRPAQAADTAAPQPVEDFERESKHDLYERAKALNIHGRSKMNRGKLIRAIRHANVRSSR